MSHKSHNVTCNLVYSEIGAAFLKIAAASSNPNLFSAANTF